MKTLHLLVLLLSASIGVYGQATLPLRADTVLIEKVGGNANLKIKDASRDSVGGIYVNIGGGVLRAIKTKKINDTTYKIGLDTIRFHSGGGGIGTIQQVLTTGDTALRYIYFKDTTSPSVDHSKNYAFVQPSNYGTTYGGVTAQRFDAFGTSTFNGVNADGRPNVVGTIWGYNHSPGGGRINTSEASFGFRSETHFQLGVGGDPSFEFHLPEVTTISGHTFRPFSMYIRKASGYTNMDMQVEHAYYKDVATGKDWLDFDYNGNVSVRSIADSNNRAISHTFELPAHIGSIVYNDLGMEISSNGTGKVLSTNMAINYGSNSNRTGMDGYGPVIMREGLHNIFNTGLNTTFADWQYSSVQKYLFQQDQAVFYPPLLLGNSLRMMNGSRIRPEGVHSLDIQSAGGPGGNINFINGADDHRTMTIFQAVSGTDTATVNIGPSTVAPSHKLRVQGSIQADSNAYIKMMDVGADADSVVTWNRSTGKLGYAKANGGGGGSADSSIFATNYGVDTAKANIRAQINGITSGASTNVFKDSSFVPLIVIFGESNASGVAANSCASAGETDSDPRIQIMQPGGAFASLDIGANNNITESTGTHGMELELQNQIATYFNNRTVYMVKAGKGGSTISQWAQGSANADTLFARMNNAISKLNILGKVPVICVWYSQGINDGVAGTDATVWKNATLELFERFWQRYGFCPILMTQLVGDRGTYPQLNSIDNAISDLALNKANYIYRIPTPQTSGGIGCADSLQSPVHWDYIGMKAVTQRMLRAMMDTAGYINYDRRTRHANLQAWQLGGNYYTDPAVNAIGTNDTAQLIFKQGGTERMRIYSNGYIGMGKIPAHPLDVNGNAMLNGLIVGSGLSNVSTSHNIILAPSLSTSGTNNFIADPSGDQNTTSFGNILIGDGSSVGGGDKNLRIRIGFQPGYNRNGHRAMFIGSQVGTWPGFSDTEGGVFGIGMYSVGALMYGNFNSDQLQLFAADTPTLKPSVALDVRGVTNLLVPKGALLCPMTAAQRLSISSPATGLEVFDTDSLRKMIYNGSGWKAVAWTTDASGGSSSNFFNADLFATADRTHSGRNHNLIVDSFSTFSWYARGNYGFGNKARGGFSFEPGFSSFIIRSAIRNAANSADTLDVNINTLTNSSLSLNANNITGRSSAITLYSDPTKSNIQIKSDSINIQAPRRTTDTVLMAGNLDAAEATNVITKAAVSDMRGYKQYTALISQSGTSDPTAIVLGRNEIGTIVWTRSGTGIYTGTLSGAFTSNKTWLTVTNTDETSTQTHVRLVRTGANTVLLTTYNGSFTPTDVFTNVALEIRVYP